MAGAFNIQYFVWVKSKFNTCTMKEARQLYAKIKQKAEHVMDKKHDEDACWDPEIGMTDFKMIGI